MDSLGVEAMNSNGTLSVSSDSATYNCTYKGPSTSLSLKANKKVDKSTDAT